MARPINIVTDIDPSAYSEIIDVRAPAEFAEDRIPGAFNLHVLDDQERAEVGTLYKQVNPFTARKLGASLVSANISKWLQQHLADKDQDYKPLIYCWRGGQRSNSMATILSAIGWEVSLLQGGYKHYRKQVIQTLTTKPPTLQTLIITGLTGTAKTRLLNLLEAAGEQVIDLEGLANHRGSLLGWDPDNPQPAQKYFESLLAEKLHSFSADKPVWLESESNKVGNLYVPEALWKKMRQSPRIEVTATMQERVSYLLRDYLYLTERYDEVGNRLTFLKERYGSAQIDAWRQMMQQQQHAALIQSLLEVHYDPSYCNSSGRYAAFQKDSIALSGLDNPQLQQAIPNLIEAASRIYSTTE